MSKRITVSVSDEVAEKIERLRIEERRPEAQMTNVLIEEAISAREAKAIKASA